MLLDAAPPVPLLVDLQAGSDSGLYDDDNLTNVPTPTIDITAAEPDDTINVYREGTLLGQATQVDGTLYQYSFASGELAEGDNSITARSSDGVEESEDSPPLMITLDLTGPRITASTPPSPVDLRADTLDSVTVTFSESLDFDPGDGSFAVEDVTIIGPEGEIAPTGIAPLGGNEYEISFGAQTVRGTYSVSVGPDIADLAGNLMDQDQDGLLGEAEEDIYTFNFDAIDADTVFTSGITIGVGDTTYDGQDICVNGSMVTIDGVHAFNSLHLVEAAVVTHTARSVDGLALSVIEDAIIDDSSMISADRRGHGSTAGPGAGASGGGQSGAGGGGGGYGGLGGNGRYGLAGGSVYGWVTEPVDLGSGGGVGENQPGRAGGGAIRLDVDGVLTVEGSLTANGRGGNTSAGGGSGGSVYVTVGTLHGGGVISANGGNIVGLGGGGGGGMVAVEYHTNAFVGTLSAHGGSGYYPGGAGTVYLKSSSQASGELW
ncbi:MAG: Ig-like domain-containing protein, partial [Planctomycetota bacterium]